MSRPPAKPLKSWWWAHLSENSSCGFGTEREQTGRPPSRGSGEEGASRSHLPEKTGLQGPAQPRRCPPELAGAVQPSHPQGWGGLRVTHIPSLSSGAKSLKSRHQLGRAPSKGSGGGAGSGSPSCVSAVAAGGGSQPLSSRLCPVLVWPSSLCVSHRSPAYKGTSPWLRGLRAQPYPVGPHICKDLYFQIGHILCGGHRPVCHPLSHWLGSVWPPVTRSSWSSSPACKPMLMFA